MNGQDFFNSLWAIAHIGYLKKNIQFILHSLCGLISCIIAGIEHLMFTNEQMLTKQRS